MQMEDVIQQQQPESGLIGNFREYLRILTGERFSLKLKGKVYATCVRSCLMHGSETWPMKVEHGLKLNRTEMSMIRWMCGVKLNDRKKSEELR